MNYRMIFACLVLWSSFGLPAQSMCADPQELRLSYQGEAYRAWPVVYGFRLNGLLNIAPESVRCCIADHRAPGSGSATSMGFFYEGPTPEIELRVMWVEVHSNTAYRARVTFSTDEIIGWTGGNVIVTFSFRPGGELVLYTDGPTLAVTRTGSDVDIRSGADMADVLLAPGLGRAHRRDDYIELRQVCGAIDPDPPAPFKDGRTNFGPATLAQIDENAALPLPDVIGGAILGHGSGVVVVSRAA